MQALRKKKTRLLFVLFLGFPVFMLRAQNSPSVASDNGLFAASPGTGGMAGNGPVLLATGAANANIPIYVVKCGSLALPITIGYSYSGFDPVEEASWVGLGWNLMAGGMVSRNIQGAVDSTRKIGRNYGQYALSDSLFQSNNSNFLQNVYQNDADTTYDTAPDIFSCSFNGYAGNFYWYNGKQYMLSYTKQFKVSWPNVTGPITLTTEDGTSYIFGQAEVVTTHIPSTGNKLYNAGWCLTSIISADKKDTILLNYGLYTWNQLSSPYKNWYVQGKNLNTTYNDSITNSMALPLLQSITCRNVRVNFLASSAARTDLQGTTPSLQEIDVIDAVSATLLKKVVFTYGYFGGTGANPAFTQRLMLKNLSFVNPTAPTDQQSYHFRYMKDDPTIVYPDKTNPAVDHWEYYNAGSGKYFSGHSDGLNRSPNLTYCSYAALDTIVYPAGGFTTFQYELNDYDSSAMQPFKPGPGIRVKTVSQFSAGMTVPALSKTYSYLADNGVSSSGVLSWTPQTSGPIYISDSVDFNQYVMSNNNPGSTILSNTFYYGKVSEQSAAGNEKHKADYYFQSFSNVFNDVELFKKIEYRYDSTTTTFTPLTVMTTAYDTIGDTTFLCINAYTDSSYTFGSALAYKYGYTYNYNNTYWKRLSSQRVVQYDMVGDSAVTTTQFNYNAARNMDSSRQTLADGRALIRKYKHPDDYAPGITGNMVAANVIGPIMENQTWLQNASSGPNLIAGSITSYDQTLFMPVSMYALEPAVPLPSLNNETIAGGKYTSLISDTSNYVLKGQLFYDNNNNLSQQNKTSDISTSYIWDYRHSLIAAQVRNATPGQVAYTSFEADNPGNWVIPDSSRNNTTAMTGSLSYNLVSGKTISAAPVAGTPYIVSYWSTSGSVTVSANGVSVAVGTVGVTKNGWTYYEHILPNTTSSVSLTATNTLIDELRLYPTVAQMSTCTYLPQIGVSSRCDVGNHIMYYTYDGFGRLKYIKDQDGNIIKTIDYHFKGQ